jgi:hypothetical protein
MSQIQTKTPKGRFENQLRFRPDSRTIRELFVLSITSFALYIPALWCSFVGDDEAEVLQDRLIRSFSNIPGFFAHSVWFFLNSGTGDRFYRPLKLLVYSIEYHLFRFQPAYWHFVNILLNTAVVVAAYFLVRDLAGHRLAFWTALWFAFSRDSCRTGRVDRCRSGPGVRTRFGAGHKVISACSIRLVSD